MVNNRIGNDNCLPISISFWDRNNRESNPIRLRMGSNKRCAMGSHSSRSRNGYLGGNGDPAEEKKKKKKKKKGEDNTNF